MYTDLHYIILKAVFLAGSKNLYALTAHFDVVLDCMNILSLQIFSLLPEGLSVYAEQNFQNTSSLLSSIFEYLPESISVFFCECAVCKWVCVLGLLKYKQNAPIVLTW